MGYNGPAPGDHWRDGGRTLVRTFIVQDCFSKKAAFAKLPQPGGAHPLDCEWVACEPSRAEAIRPTTWNIDVPYVKLVRGISDAIAPPKSKTMAPEKDYFADYFRSKGFHVPAKQPGERYRIVNSPVTGSILGIDVEPDPDAPAAWKGQKVRGYDLAPNLPAWQVLAVVLAILFAVAWLCPARAFGQTLPTTRPAVKYPAGITVAWYYPPLENLATVKARGCNAVVGPELGSPARCTVKQWCDEASRLGLGVILDRKALVAGYAPDNLIGWIVRDEPDSANHNYPPEDVSREADDFRMLRADVPVFCTFAGDKLTSAGPRDIPKYLAYLANIDVAMGDWYVTNREFARYPLDFKRQELEFLKARGARTVGSVIETSWQKLNNASPKGRAPTPDELESQVTIALNAGARFVVYFSTAERGYPWPLAYDPTPVENVARITTINARLNPPTTQPSTQPSTLPTTNPTPDVLTRLADLERRAAEQDAWREKLRAAVGGANP